MRKIIEAILKMPYYRNYQAQSGYVHNIAKHEDAIEKILDAHGLKKTSGAIKIAQRDEWLRTGVAPELADNSFLSQPCGTHNNPDFIVKQNGVLYFMECKSVKGGTPMYNSGVPKPRYIYVLSSEKHNETTVYWGKDILPTPYEQALYEHIEDARRRDQQFNEQHHNNHGICYYTRPMIQHKGSKKIKDYFLNPRRKELEQRVINGV